MNSHEIDYELIGDDMQIVEVELDPGETVIAEAGAMNYMEDNITFEAKMGDGSKPNQGLFGKLLDVGKRALTGESIFMTHFTNNGMGKKGSALPLLTLGKSYALTSRSIIKTFFARKTPSCVPHLEPMYRLHFKKNSARVFGGKGFILQKLSGDGKAFVHAGGTVVRKQLNGETLRVDAGCIVAFEENINYDVQMAGGLKSMIFGGEGLFLATLSGFGTVWLQSLPFSRLADRVLQNAPSAAGKSQGEGSVLGGLGRIIDGD